MRSALAVLGVAVLVLLPDASAQVGYGGSGEDCRLHVFAQPAQPQALVQCKVSQEGTLTTSNSTVDCLTNGAGCFVNVTGMATGTIQPPGPGEVVSMILWLTPQGSLLDVQPICSKSVKAPNTASNLTCTAALVRLFVGVSAGACQRLRVTSAVVAAPVDVGQGGLVVRLAFFSASASADFQICRDAAGAPSILPFP